MTAHDAYNFLSFGSFRGKAEHLQESYEKNKAHRRVMWITREGDKIRVGALSDTHLRNIAQYLLRVAGSVQRDIPFPNFQGEHAQELAESEYDRWTEADPGEVATWLFGNRAVAIFQECRDRQIDYGDIP